MNTPQLPECAVIDRRLPAALLHDSAFPHIVTSLGLRETLISWVFLTGPFAYKVKKPLKLEYVDCSTLERRHALCDAEMRLNKRLAPDIYLDVVTVTESDGVTRIGGKGKTIDHAVRMQQFDSSQELSALLDSHSVRPEELADFARRIACFHESLPRAVCDSHFRHTNELRGAVLGNLAVLLSHFDGETDLSELNFLVDWTHDYLHDSLEMLRLRERSGAIRECHGDLHAGNVVRWRGSLIAFDCLEFDPRLRWIDVINDVAFLTMDLLAHDRRDLAFIFLNTYLEHTGDYEGVRHLAFYCAYRALVRATIDAMDAETDAGHRQEHQKRFAMHVKVAVTHACRTAPALILMHGLSGSGKSWLSEALIPLVGTVRLRSDVERRRLSQDAGGIAALHDSAVNRDTYARLLGAAEDCLRGGVNTLVDATFLKTDDRRRFHALAQQLGCPLLILSCTADVSVLTQRINARAALGHDPSDADSTVLARQFTEQESFREDEQALVATIDTTSPDAIRIAHEAISMRIGLPGT
jgi:aminoglycoside phosphotransferase family enzyme/predicted kinase